MFHNTLTSNSINSRRNNLLARGCFLIFLLGATGFCIAQEPLYPPYEDPPGDPQEGPRRGNEPLDFNQAPEPKTMSSEGEVSGLVEENEYGEARSRGGQTFRDDVFLNLRNRLGFSLNIYQGYTEDISRNNQENQSAGVTSATGRIFINFGRRRSRLHLDFGAGYRRYTNNREVGNPDYNASLEYSYQLARRTSLQISDQFTYSYNDSWSFNSLNSPLSYDPNFSNEVVLNRQRITRNTLRSELRHEIGRRISLGVFGGYNYYSYPQETLVDAHAIEAGGDFNIQLTGWLYLTNSYSTYLNNVDEQYHDARIHRLQVGGLDFRLSRSWRIWAGGGVEYTDYQNNNHIGESVNAGIGYTSSNTAFSLTYQRGFTSAIGISRLLQSDIASVALGYRISNRISSRVEGFYYRSTDQSDYGNMDTYSVGGGLEFALCSYLQLTLNGYYQNQRTRNFSVEGLGIERLTTYLGLQFVWPEQRHTEH